MENFLRKGTFKNKDKSFPIFYKDCKGFINEGALKLGNFFNTVE